MKTRSGQFAAFALFFTAVAATSQDSAPRSKVGDRVAKPPVPAVRSGSTGGRPARPLGGGDTCGSAAPIGSLPFADAGNTTGAANDVSDVPVCNTLPSPNVLGPDQIYSFTVGAGNSLTINVTPTAPYDTDIYVLSTCGNPTSCVAWSSLDPSCGMGCTEVIGPMTFAPGTYYLYVDSFYTTDPTAGAPRFNPGRAQGPYSVSVTGTLGAVSTPTFTNTPTNTPSNTPTNSPSNTPSNTPTNSPTNTGTITPSNTPTNTATNTPTGTRTPTNTPTLTPTTTGGGGPGGPGANIPMLSGSMLALFALALAGVALFLTRRS